LPTRPLELPVFGLQQAFKAAMLGDGRVTAARFFYGVGKDGELGVVQQDTWVALVVEGLGRAWG
jgi:hypothetical protein